MKLNLILLLLIIIKIVNCGQLILTTKFVPKIDCYSDQGCNIIDESYWDNATAFNQPNTTSFEIMITSETATNNNKPIILNFDKSIVMGQLSISFPSESSSGETGTINILNGITVNDDIQLLNCEIFLNGDGIQSSLMSDEIMLHNTTITIKNGGFIANSNLDPDNQDTPLINIDSNSSINLYDTSSITGELINVFGNILLSGNSNLVSSNQLKLSNAGGIVSSINSKINCDKFSVSTAGSTQSILSGTNVINQLYLTPIDNTPTNTISITFGNKSTIQYLELSKNSVLITGSNSFVTIVDAQLDGGITVSPSSSLRINQNNDQNITVNGVINLSTNSNSYFSNMIFPTGSIISTQLSKYSNITIEYGTVEFLDGLSIFGQILLLQNTTFYTSNGQLMLELCILSNGGTTIVDGSLVCQNQDYYQNSDSTLIVNNGTKTWTRVLYNQGGLVVVNGENVALNCDIESSGVFQLTVDSNVFVKGHFDLLTSNSILDIGGIGANTIKPAIGVRDIMTLDGTLFYNISIPLDGEDSVYYLIDTNIEIDGNFTQFTCNPNLANLDANSKISFVFTQSSGTVHPGSLEIEFNLTPKNHHLDKIWIAVGIIVPLLVIAILVVGIWKYKKSRKYNEYKSLSDDVTDHIFNNNNDIDDNFDL